MFHWWWVEPVEPVFSCFFLQPFQGLLPGFMSALTACSAQKQWQRALCLYETLEGGLAWREVSMNLGHTGIPQRKMNMMLLPDTTCTKPHWIWEAFHKCCHTKDVSRHICSIHIYIYNSIILYYCILSKHVWHSPQILCGWFAFSVTARPLGPGVNMPKSLIIELNPLVMLSFWRFRLTQFDPPFQ